jgi:hypothetical protein
MSADLIYWLTGEFQSVYSEVFRPLHVTHLEWFSDEAAQGEVPSDNSDDWFSGARKSITDFFSDSTPTLPEERSEETQSTEIETAPESPSVWESIKRRSVQLAQELNLVSLDEPEES